ncbi:MAG: hypothetical protein ACKOD2_04480, partial [Ilumatobacteraceae bacterium]
EPVPGLNTDDWVYELGRGWVAPTFDEEVTGAVKGAELKFTATPTGTDQPADFEVTVQRVQTLELADLTDEWVAEGFDDHLIGATASDVLTFSAPPSGTSEPADFKVSLQNVQELVLPEPTDEWVAENLPGHDSLAAWTDALRTRIYSIRLNHCRQVLIDRTTTALAALVDIEPPKTMVDQELQARVENFIRDLQQRGISVDHWLSATGQDTNTLIETFREQATKAVVVDLALRAVADAEAVEVDEHDIESEYARIAMRSGMKAKDVRRAYEKNDAVFDLVAQLRKSKALDWLLHNTEIVDESGQPVDRDLLLGHDHDDHDHDDHDHGDHDDDASGNDQTEEA